MSTLFKSIHPILEACMNQGSTVELGIAVYNAGAYPSLCSWTYLGDYQKMRDDLDSLILATGSPNVHLSFGLHEILKNSKLCYSMIKDYKIPTVEIVYEELDDGPPNLDELVITALKPISDMGTKIFKRIRYPVTAEVKKKHLLDGFCIKGSESAGKVTNEYTVKELFLLQQSLTPDAMLIPYGGVGSPEQVKEYIDIGAEIVAVGTVLAYCKESPVKSEAKQAVLNSKKDSITTFSVNRPGTKNFSLVQNVVKFDTYTEKDDLNHTKSVIAGMFNTTTTQGHLFVGHGIEHITEILPCDQIIRNLVSHL